MRDYVRKTCHTCENDYQKIRRYRVNRSDFMTLIKKQNFCCAICKKPFEKTPNIDHDHDTGIVRGLLCSNCNVGIGMFQHNTVIIKSAMSYISNATSTAPNA